MKEAGMGLAAKVPRRLDMISVILVLSSTQLAMTDFIPNTPKCQWSTLPSRNASLYPPPPQAEKPRCLCGSPGHSGLVHSRGCSQMSPSPLTQQQPHVPTGCGPITECPRVVLGCRLPQGSLPSHTGLCGLGAPWLPQ